MPNVNGRCVLGPAPHKLRAPAGGIGSHNREAGDDVADWLGSLAQVAGVAGQLVSAFLMSEDGAESSAETGDSEWSYVQQAGKSPVIFAKNGSNAPVGLTFTLAREHQNLSVHQPLDPGNAYDATADVEQFLEGNVSAAPTVPEGVEGPGSRTVSFAISFLALGASVAVIKGVTLSYDRTPTGFKASIKTDAVTPISARVTARDASGNAVSASLKVGQEASVESGVYEVELPPGVDLDPVADQLDLQLELPAAFYAEATRERGERQLALEAVAS